MSNPILARKSLETGPEEVTGTPQLSKQETFDPSMDAKRVASVFFFSTKLDEVKDGISNAASNIRHIDVEMQARKAWILLERAWFTLAKREKLVLGSTLVAIAFAVLIGVILGESTNESGSVVGSFCIGSLMMLMSNVQFVFFLFGKNEVCWYYESQIF